MSCATRRICTRTCVGPFDAALDTLASLGAQVVDVSLPLTEIAGAIFVGIADTEGAGGAGRFDASRAGTAG